MANALQSACIDMANPDEDSDTQPKSAKLCNKDGDCSTIVEAEDLPAFLNHLTYCKCITAMDAKLILEAITENQRLTQAKYQTSSATTVHKQNADTQSSFEKYFRGKI